MQEYLDIVDEKGDPTGEIVERTVAHAQGILHRTAHVWLARRKEGRVQVLLQKRSANKDSHPGCYDISSAGHIPAGDSYRTSAIRELKEELGVEAREADLVFCGDRTVVWDDIFYGKSFHDRQVSRVFLLWLDQEESAFTVQTEEVECVKWMDLDACIRGVEMGTFANCISMEELDLLKDTIG